MDFNFTEEQVLLRNMVHDLVRDKYSFEKRVEISTSDSGMSQENWQEFASLGLLSASFSEEFGGFGGGSIETMIIMEEFGSGLVTEPYLPSIVLCGGMLSRHANVAQKEKYIPSMSSGDSIWALAYSEVKGRFHPAYVETSAIDKDDGYVLTGNKSVVLGGQFANWLIVSARYSGSVNDESGLGLFIVDCSAQGVSRHNYETIDGGRACDVNLSNVFVSKTSLIGRLGEGFEILDEALDYGIAALCAEAIGNMQATNIAVIEYCKTRQQFGMSLSKFQVLQHRMVDMFMECEQAISMTYMVNMKVNDPSLRRKACSAAKVKIGQAGRFIGQNAVQLHGGMGMTYELNIGHYFKRLTSIETIFGSTDYHLQRYGSLDE